MADAASGAASTQQVPFLQTATAGGLFGGLGSIVSGGMTAFFNRLAQDRAFKQNVEMWNMQNEYNTPANQMRRFSEAGLNPNLIYGQGSSGNASGAPQMDSLRYDFKNPTDSVALANAMSNIMMQKAQIKSIEADTKNKEIQSAIFARDALAAQFEMNAMENEGPTLKFSPWFLGIQDKALRNALSQQKLDFLDKMNPLSLATAREDLSGKRIRNWQAKLDYEFSKQMNPLKLRNMSLQNQQTARNLSLINAKIGLLGAQTANEQYEGMHILPYKSSLTEQQAELYKWAQGVKIGAPVLKFFKFLF